MAKRRTNFKARKFFCEKYFLNVAERTKSILILSKRTEKSTKNDDSREKSTKFNGKELNLATLRVS